MSGVLAGPEDPARQRGLKPSLHIRSPRDYVPGVEPEGAATSTLRSVGDVEGSNPWPSAGLSAACSVSGSGSGGEHWWGPVSFASQTQLPSGASFQRPSGGPGPSH